MLAIIFINHNCPRRATKILDHSLAGIHLGQHPLKTAVYLLVQPIYSVDFVHYFLLVDGFFAGQLWGFRPSRFVSMLPSQIGDVYVLLEANSLFLFGFHGFFDEIFLCFFVFVSLSISFLWHVGRLVFSFKRLVLSHIAFLCKSIEIFRKGCFGGLPMDWYSVLRSLESSRIRSSSILNWLFWLRRGIKCIVMLVEARIAIPCAFLDEGVVDLGPSADGRCGENWVFSIVSAGWRILVGIEIEILLDLGVDVVLEPLLVVVHAIVRL